MVTIDALTASWPSRNTVARTGIRSPGTAFAGYAPPSMTGETFATGTRPTGAPSLMPVSTSTAVSVLALTGVSSLMAVTFDNLSARFSARQGWRSSQALVSVARVAVNKEDVMRGRFARSVRGATAGAAGALLLGIGLIGGGAVPAQAAGPGPGPGAPTAGDSLFPTDGNGGYDVTHYGIALSYHRSAKSISASSIWATTTITARALRPLTSFVLDLEGLTVTSVRVNRQSTSWSRSGHKLTVVPQHTVRGTFTTVIDYRGVPKTHIDPDNARTAGSRPATGRPCSASRSAR